MALMNQSFSIGVKIGKAQARCIGPDMPSPAARRAIARGETCLRLTQGTPKAENLAVEIAEFYRILFSSAFSAVQDRWPVDLGTPWRLTCALLTRM